MGPVTTLRRRILSSFVLAGLALAVFGGCACWAVWQLHDEARWVSHTQLVLRQVNAARSALEQAAAAQREYVLLGFDAALRDYGEARAELPKVLAEIRRSTADNPEQQRRLDEAERLVDARIKLSDESVRLRRDRGAEASRRFLAAGAARAALVDARKAIDGLRQAERELLDRRTRAQERHASLALAAVAAGMVLALSMLGISARATLSEVARRRELEEELESFFELSEDLLCIADFEGRFLRVNAAWERMLGYGAGDLLYRPLLDFVHPDDRAKTAAEAAGLARGRGTVAFENRYRCRDGSYSTLRWTCTPSPEHRRIYAVARDVTLELELARMRMELTHHINHELRNPAAAILMSLAMMQEYRERPAFEAERLLESALSSARHLKRMIDDLLDVTRLETGKLSVVLETVELDAVLQSCLETTRPSAKQRGVALAADLAPGLRASADPVRVRQVVCNLLDNAVKFTPKGGTIRLSSRRDPASSDTLVVSVADTGPGIPAEDLERIFDRLYQTQRSAKQGSQGLGLGLAICKELVERQGGRIWAESAPGKGSTLSFTLAAT